MIYLDNCATTKIRPEVLETMITSLEGDFANPSSLHSLGHQTEKKIRKARQILADYLKVDEKEIYFTSGGTESNNIAVQSIAKGLSKSGNHIITSKIEHPSILNIMKELETKGFKVTYLGVDKYGQISLEELENSLQDETILIALMHVNNEIGTIEHIKEIKRIIKAKESQALLHVDGVQSFGKISFSLKESDIDTFSFSSHKIHGPKGVGGLYIKKGSNLAPIVFGGNQEAGLRSGTENVPGIIAFGKAVEITSLKEQEERKHAEMLKAYTIELLEEIEDIKINSKLDESFSPYILSVSLRNTRGEVLLHFLEQEEIYISTSSACSSHGTKKSSVLKAIGLDDNDIEGTIRICFSYENTREDIEIFASKLKKSTQEIRKITMR
nr:cysteine desulfurase family protein [Tissierella sp.]